MVVELSKLAGIMAREYAVRAGETPEVARRAARDGDAALGRRRRCRRRCPVRCSPLADRLDLLAGLFGIGAEPKGSSDPFGLRRAALGALAILRAHPRLAGDHRLRPGWRSPRAKQPVEVAEARMAKAAEFIAGRYEQALLDAGHPHRLVQAVLPLAATSDPGRRDARLRCRAGRRRQRSPPGRGGAAGAPHRPRRHRRPATTPRSSRSPAEGALADAMAKARAELGDAPADLDALRRRRRRPGGADQRLLRRGAGDGRGPGGQGQPPRPAGRASGTSPRASSAGKPSPKPHRVSESVGHSPRFR